MSEGREGERSQSEHAPDAERVYRNAHDQLELRLIFAEAVAAKRGIEFIDALREFTDVYVRALGVWPGESADAEERWNQLAASLRAVPEREKRIRIILEQFKKQIESAREKQADTPHWPFRYDYDEKSKTVHMHFGTLSPAAEQASDAPGILSRERYAEQREKLAAMFRDIKEKHPTAERVWGSSWLYNREAYRRLYPASYTSIRTPRKGGFRGGGRWGQFRDKTGGVNPETKASFLKNIENLDPENLEAAFPNQSLDVEAPIEDFYKEYGIE